MMKHIILTITLFACTFNVVSANINNNKAIVIPSKKISNEKSGISLPQPLSDVPMYGTYSIGSEASNDFNTLQNAINYLKNHGASGDITFEIAPGTYNDCSVNIDSIHDWDESFRLTIKGMGEDSSQVVLKSSNNGIIKIKDIPQVSLDNLTIQRTILGRLQDNGDCLNYENNIGITSIKITKCCFESSNKVPVVLISNTGVDTINIVSCSIRNKGMTPNLSITSNKPNIIISNVMIKNCEIIESVNISTFMIEDVHIENSDLGAISLFGQYEIKNIKIQNSDFDYGIWLFSNMAKNIQLNKISLNKTSSILYADVNLIDGFYMENCQFINSNYKSYSAIHLGNENDEVRNIKLNNVITSGDTAINILGQSIQNIQLTKIKIDSSVIGVQLSNTKSLSNIEISSSIINSDSIGISLHNKSIKTEAENLNIYNNTISGYFGINMRTDSVENFIFSSNHVESSYAAVYATPIYINQATLKQNNLKSNYFGLGLGAIVASNIDIADNILTGNTYGIFSTIDSINGDFSIAGNNININAVTPSTSGIVLTISNNATPVHITNNLVELENSSDGYGIYANVFNSLNILNNKLTSTGDLSTGIIASNVTTYGQTGELLIEGNEITGYTTSIGTGQISRGLTIKNNYLEDFVTSGLILNGIHTSQKMAIVDGNTIISNKATNGIAMQLMNDDADGISIINNEIIGDISQVIKAYSIKKLSFNHNSVSIQNDVAINMFELNYVDTVILKNNIINETSGKKGHFYSYRPVYLIFGHNLYYSSTTPPAFFTFSDTNYYSPFSFEQWKNFEYNRENKSQFLFSEVPFRNYSNDLRLNCGATLPITADMKYSTKLDKQGLPRKKNVHPGAYQNDAITHPQSSIEIIKCEDESIDLEPLVFEGATFDWSNGSTSRTITVNDPGEYFVTTFNDCQNYPQVFNVENLLLKSDFSYENYGLQLILNNLSLGENNYQWNFGDGAQSSLETPSHTYTNGGLYEVELIASNKCGTSLSSKQINIYPLGSINGSINSSISIYPNPSNDGNITIAIPPGEKAKTATISIYSFGGKKLFEERNLESSTMSLELSLNKGLYLLILEYGDHILTEKLIIN